MDDDQRRAPRVDVEPDFSILRSDCGQNIIAIVYNISQTGVLLDVSQNDGLQNEIAEGKCVKFLSAPDFLWSALSHIRGRIVRQDNQHWGVQFEAPLPLSDTEIERLQDYLEVPSGPDWSRY